MRLLFNRFLKMSRVVFMRLLLRDFQWLCVLELEEIGLFGVLGVQVFDLCKLMEALERDLK